MNNPSLRNILIVMIAIVVAIIALSFLSTLLSSIIPIAITAIVAFILGRASVRYNLLDVVRSALAARPAVQKAADVLQKTAAAPRSAEAPVAKPKTPSPEAESIPQKPINPDLLLDPNFEVRTPEQIEAESRLREQEATKRATSTDVNAALEERRKRLLGNKSDSG